MAGVIIEELDNSSEESFDTPKSSHSADEFHEPAESLQDNTSEVPENASTHSLLSWPTLTKLAILYHDIYALPFYLIAQ